MTNVFHCPSIVSSDTGAAVSLHISLLASMLLPIECIYSPTVKTV